MPEFLSLPPARNKKSLLTILVVIIAFCFGFGAISLLLPGKTIKSVHALVEGYSQSLLSPADGSVASVFVAEGQTVNQGQILLSLEEAPLLLAVQEARAALLVAAQGGVPPDDASQDLSKNISELATQATTLRDAEQRSQQFLEHWTAEHTRAMLVLRSGQSVSEADRAKAVSDEAAARTNMMTSKSQLEAASTQRADVETRLQRLRDARNAPRPGPTQIQLWQARLTQAENALANATLYAPANGKITAFSVREGQQVRAGQALLLFVGNAEQAGSFWVTAWFNKRQGLQLREGQPCRIFIEDGPELDGSIASLMPDHDGYMVRVNLEASPAAQGITSGQSASVRVSAR